MIVRLTALLMTFLVGVVGYCPHTVTTVHNKRGTGTSALQILFNCYCEGAVSNFLGFS